MPIMLERPETKPVCVGDSLEDAMIQFIRLVRYENSAQDSE